MSLYASLSLGAQTAYAQLFDARIGSGIQPVRRKPEGVVRRKNREGQEILVFPAYGRRPENYSKSTYGPDSARIKALIKEHGSQRKAAPHCKSSSTPRSPSVASRFSSRTTA